MRGEQYGWSALALLVIAGSGLGLGCGSEGGRPSGVYQPRLPEKTLVMREWHDGVEAGARPMRIAGEREIEGRTYEVLEVGHLDREEPDGEQWFVTFSDDEVVFAGGEVFYPSSTLAPGVPNVTATVVEPIVIPLDLPVGEPHTVPVLGTVLMGDPAGSPTIFDIDEELTVTLVGEDEVVETFLGDMAAADHYQATATLLDMPASADIWWTEENGLARAEYTWAGVPGQHGMAIETIVAALSAGSGYENLVSETLIDATTPSVQFSSQDVHGEWDADKDSHALMVLELRWASDEMARTTTQPPVYEEFSTGWGYFPSNLSATDVSLFHPEEVGQGYTYWTAVVDQAAKNESVNGITFNITATWNSGAGTSSPDEGVRASALILYKLWSGE